LVLLDELLRERPRDVRRVVIRVVRALELLARVGKQLVRVPAVRADEHVALDAGALRLTSDLHHRVVVDGRVDCFDVRVLDLADVRREVRLALEEALLDSDLASDLLGFVSKLPGETRRVEVIRREQDRYLLLLLILDDEARADLTLHVVGEANAEDE